MAKISDLPALAGILATDLIVVSRQTSSTPVAYTTGRISGDSILKLVSTTLAPALALFTAGKNKFNAAGATVANAQINGATGAVQVNAAFNTTVYTDLQPAVAATKYVANSAANVIISWFDATRAWLSNSNANSGAPATSPANTAFMCYTVSNSVAPAGLQIEAGAVPTAYESYRFVLSMAALPAITTGNIADGAITTAKTAFFAAGKNKFNAAGSVVANSQLSATGGIQTNAAFSSRVFDTYMPAIPSTAYISNSAIASTIAFYTADLTFISSAPIYNTTPAISPANAAAWRLSVSNSVDTSTLQIEIGTAVTYWEPYQQSVTVGPTTGQINSALKWAANDLTLPRKSYLLKGVENNFYHRCLQRRWAGDLFFTRMSGTVGGQNMLSRERYSRITPTATGTATITATLYDGELDPLVTKTTSAIVTDPATPNAPLNLLCVGDSYLDIGVILKTVVTTIPNVTLLGTRKVTNIQGAAWNGQDLRFEGRSGADMAYLFTAIKSPSAGAGATGFSAFIHPPGYSFIGNTNSWKTAAAQTAGATFVASLFSAAQTFRGGFSASTGYPAAPQANDLLWDDTAGGFFFWNGSAWTSVAIDTSTFAFSISKYLSVWGVAAPKIVYCAMGVNDFQGAATWRDIAGATGPNPQPRNTFAKWHNAGGTGYMDQLIASVQAYDPTIKIMILVPSTLSEDMNNLAGRFTRSMNAAMWEARKQILATWDTPAMEAAGIYVLDAGRAVDPKYGYSPSAVAGDSLPFAQYAEALVEPKGADAIHPSAAGFTQIGVAVSAGLQAVR